MFIVRLPLVSSFETSFSVQTHREALLLKIVSDDVCGWGECVTAPAPYYCYETNSTSIHIIKKFLVTLLMTLRNFSIHDVLLKFERIRGHHMAKAAVENALLDLTKAIELNPEYGAAYYSRANLHSKMGNTDLATEDIEMMTNVTEVNIETFANGNNIWRSRHLHLESIHNDNLAMER